MGQNQSNPPSLHSNQSARQPINSTLAISALQHPPLHPPVVGCCFHLVPPSLLLLLQERLEHRLQTPVVCIPFHLVFSFCLFLLSLPNFPFNLCSFIRGTALEIRIALPRSPSPLRGYPHRHISHKVAPLPHLLDTTPFFPSFLARFSFLFPTCSHLSLYKICLWHEHMQSG
jgi:hypothetical protein